MKQIELLKENIEILEETIRILAHELSLETLDTEENWIKRTVKLATYKVRKEKKK